MLSSARNPSTATYPPVSVILILKPNTDRASESFAQLTNHLESLDDISFTFHDVHGEGQVLTEVYLLGDTARLSKEAMASLPCVERAVRVQESYRILGRHGEEDRQEGFDYNGVRFSQDDLHVFAGLCAVDTPEHVEIMMKALKEHGQQCTRMGAYKPRTSPYSFQGHGASCLPWVFELAGKYDIRVIAMEVTHERHIDEIDEALEKTGNPTGVMLQIGTRNTQNFELLKHVGRQKRHPVLFKRGFGITLNESLNAAEYLASEGNPNVVFALRGMKNQGGDPHRNMVDFTHVPVVKRLTRMPVCVDPSHSVGSRHSSPDGLLDVFHATAQGVIAGANMVLVDFHPKPAGALVDGPQALRMSELGWFLEDVSIAREAYLLRRKAADRASKTNN
jgi:3-deoxy-7-phosphoheptulonate synthase